MIRLASLKAPALALGAVSLTLSAIAPIAVSAQTQYDGYCYAKKEDITGKNALIGAGVGAVAGSLLGKKGKKGESAAIGAAAGAGVGYIVAKNSKEKVRCSKGRYYVYSKGYYEPREAAEGFRLVFFEERPANVDLYTRGRDGRDYPYKGR